MKSSCVCLPEPGSAKERFLLKGILPSYYCQLLAQSRLLRLSLSLYEDFVIQN